MRERIRAALSGRPKRHLPDGPRRRAAVLVPLYEREGEAYVLLTKRADDLPHHQGQIGFPGGGAEPGDGSLRATALREAFEEVGLAPEAVEIIGELDDTETASSNFVVTPFVGWVPYPYPFATDHREIQELIEVPLAAFRDPGRLRVEIWEREGRERPVYFYDVGPHTVWGLTARILREFLAILDADPAGRTGLRR